MTKPKFKVFNFKIFTYEVFVRKRAQKIEIFKIPHVVNLSEAYLC